MEKEANITLTSNSILNDFDRDRFSASTLLNHPKRFLFIDLIMDKSLRKAPSDKNEANLTEIVIIFLSFLGIK